MNNSVPNFDNSESPSEKLLRLIKILLQPNTEIGENQKKIYLKQLLLLIPYLLGIKKTTRDSRIKYDDALNRALESFYRALKNENDRRGLPNSFSFLVGDINHVDAEEFRKRFTNWFNKIINYKIIDLQRQLNKCPSSIDYYEKILPDPKLSGLDRLCEEEEQKANQNRLEKVKDSITNKDSVHITEDLKKRLQDHPKGYPDCTCQELIIRRLLGGREEERNANEERKYVPEKWKDIAKDLRVPYGTVTAHWHRKCLPLLTEIKNNLEA